MTLVQAVAGRFVVDNQGTIVCFWVVTDVIANVQCVSAVLFDYNTRPFALSGPLPLPLCFKRAFICFGFYIRLQGGSRD